MMNKVLEEKNEALFDELVPASGFADTVAGELVRAVNRIGYRFWNDGDQIGIGYGNETCNAAARYIMDVFDGTEMAKTVCSLWGMYSEKLYESGVEMLVAQMIDYLEKNPELKSEENEYDMLDFSEYDDKHWEELEDEDWDDYGESLMEQDLREYPARDWRR